MYHKEDNPSLVTQGEPALHQGRLRIGLLLDKATASKYVYDFANWTQNRRDLIVAHLILHPVSRSGRHPTLLGWLLNTLTRVKGVDLFRAIAYLASRMVFRIILKIERFLLSRAERYRDHLDEFDLSKIIPSQIVISPIVSTSGFVYRFGADDIEALKSLNLDLMIRCGGGILRGDILKAAKLGIISFHHADNRINRGVPAGFWEVFFRQDTTGFTIQRLTEELDGGDVLMRGHVQTQYYYLLNQAALYDKSTYYLKSVVEKIAMSRMLPTILPKFPYSTRLFRFPNTIESVIYLAKLLGLIINNNLQKFLRLEYGWNVAFIRSHWRSAVLWRGLQLENPSFHYLADPFVVTQGGKEVCFVEEFSYRAQKGSIAAYALMDGASRRIGVALQESFHLSFPFVFEHKDELYMCPETSQNRDIRIYRCLEFPLRWTLQKIVMKDISAVDTIFLELNGKWWMFTNIDWSGCGDYFELSIFSSDSPLSDSWVPHARNPIFVDAGRARNAGLVKDGHRYFRISQSQGFNTYGKKALINEITELTETSYSEIVASELLPNFKRGITAIHHLHSNGTTTVFDYARLSRIRK
jgi:hypothetical protein